MIIKKENTAKIIHTYHTMAFCIIWFLANRTLKYPSEFCVEKSFWPFGDWLFRQDSVKVAFGKKMCFCKDTWRHKLSGVTDALWMHYEHAMDTNCSRKYTWKYKWCYVRMRYGCIMEESWTWICFVMTLENKVIWLL